MNRVDFILNEKKSVSLLNQHTKSRLIVELKTMYDSMNGKPIIYGKVITQSEELTYQSNKSNNRSRILWEEGKYYIRSFANPELLKSASLNDQINLWLRGADKELDNKKILCEFDTMDQAKEVLRILERGIAEINKGNYNKSQNE